MWMADGDFDPGPGGIGRPLELGCGNDDKRFVDKGRSSCLGRLQNVTEWMSTPWSGVEWRLQWVGK